MAPIFATLMSIKFLNERITRFRAFLIGLAFFGAFLMVSEAKFELGDRDFVGMSFAFLGAIFYAMIPTLGRFLKNIESKVLTFAQLAVASVVLLPLVGDGKSFLFKCHLVGGCNFGIGSYGLCTLKLHERFKGRGS